MSAGRILRLPRQAAGDGPLILVNRTHPLRLAEETLQSRLGVAVTGYPDILLEQTAADALQALLAACAAGNGIVPVSGYRSGREQETLYETSLRENGETFTKQYIAYPGTSEHQTGLAIDVGKAAREIDFIRPAFPYTGLCQRFRELAPAYGFIERYQAGKETITGVAQEPWHFRYVGTPHATLIARDGLTLEEYTASLQLCSLRSPRRLPDGTRIYVVPAGEDDTDIPLPAQGRVEISGNNAGGFVVTVRPETPPFDKSE